MAAHGNVHLSKEVDHLIDGYPEFACHVVNEKLAQALPPGNPTLIASAIPFASPASLTPITATASRPAISPSSREESSSITRTFFAARSETILSKLFCDASLATSAIFTFPRRAASRTCCTPTTASRPRIPRPARPRIFRLAAWSIILPFSYLYRSTGPPRLPIRRQYRRR